MISDVSVISIVWLGEKRVGRFAGLKAAAVVSGE
jgi:hypothetical protein